jgi:predicted RNase H-like HicB family nuclease
VDARRGWYITGVTFTIDLEREEDGRWIAEVPALPGVLWYGQDRDEAVACVQALALRVIAERLETGKRPPSSSTLRSGRREQLARHQNAPRSCRLAADWLGGQAPIGLPSHALSA